jgi:hypothetical protein
MHTDIEEVAAGDANAQRMLWSADSPRGGSAHAVDAGAFT